MVAKRAVFRLAWRFGLAIFLALSWSLPSPRPSSAAVITVWNVDDSGYGSLRDAIEVANNNPGPDTIAFNLGMTARQGYNEQSGTWTINLASPLPALTGQTTIDGSTQTAQTGDTNPKGPEVILSGENLSAGDYILSLGVGSGGNTILGLAFTGSASGGLTRPYAAISVWSSGNTIADNYIGLHPYNWTARPINRGIEIYEESNELRNNTIVASEDLGIFLGHSFTGGSNWVHLNKIGVNPTYQALGNGRDGISVWSSGNIIEGNTISGNSQNGIAIESGSSWNSIRNNFLGEHGNGVGNGYNGILIEGGAKNNTVSGNMIAGNSQDGVLIRGMGTDGNVLQGNYIGGNPERGLLMPNGWHGIGIYDAAVNNVVGDSVNAALGNVIGLNGWSGVAIVRSSYNTVAHNNIGTDGDGWINLGNGFYGVAVAEGDGNTIGPGNRIAYNGLATFADGVRIDGGAIAQDATHNRITQNSIYGNGGQGIMLVYNGNNEQSAPYISEASCRYVRGSACPNCTVEIFSDAGEQGRRYEGSTTANPNFEWTGIVHGPNVSVTADNKGNTSSFSVRHAVCQAGTYLPLAMNNY